jgi:hypothetical protein
MLNASAAEMAQIPFMEASVSRRDEGILQVGCKPTNNDADGHVISRRTPFDDRSTNAIVPAQRALRRKVRERLDRSVMKPRISTRHFPALAD